jgi:hypothetical protein
VEFDRVVPPSGNMQVAGRQFWLGPARAGAVIRFWADTQLIHLSAGGARIKTLRSHLSVADLAKLAAAGAVNAGPSPLPPIENGQAIEVERPVSRGGPVCFGKHRLLAAEILGGQLVGIRIEAATLMFYDPGTRVLLRTRPNPLTPAEVARLRGARPAGPPPQPAAEPVRVQRRASATGVIVVCGQKIALGRSHAGQTLPSPSPTPRWPSSSTTRRPVSCGAPPLRQSVTSKPTGRGWSPHFPRANDKHHLARIRPAEPGTRHTHTPTLTRPRFDPAL